jgi:hypothetical protein
MKLLVKYDREALDLSKPLRAKSQFLVYNDAMD